LRVVAMSGVHMRGEQAKKAALARAEKLQAPGEYDFLDATIERWFGNPVSDGHKGSAAHVRRVFTKLDHVGYARAYGVFATSDSIHKHRFGSLTMPTLYMTGELDANSSPAMSRAMSELTPNARAELVHNAGHMINMTHPEQVNNSLSQFLAQPLAAQCTSAEDRRC